MNKNTLFIAGEVSGANEKGQCLRKHDLNNLNGFGEIKSRGCFDFNHKAILDSLSIDKF